MIKIEQMYTSNWEAALRGMRNPLNSWDKADSIFEPEIKIGPNDLDLAKRLVNAGKDHAKFMRMITFSCDITAPMYWWKEMDTYKVGTVRNSCSTMHKITAKEFDITDFSSDQLMDIFVPVLEKTVEGLNAIRDKYLDIDKTIKDNLVVLKNLNEQMKTAETATEISETGWKIDNLKEQNDRLTVELKEYWWQLIQLLPSSYNQRATWSANYEVLRNIYKARHKHKLDEWKDFCIMIKSLPYSELITM